MIGVVVLGGFAAMWLLRLVAERILRHDDRRATPTVAEEAERWLRDRQR